MPKFGTDKSNLLTPHIPAWASLMYIVFGVILVPWTIYLGLTLPARHVSAHWDASWTGLDIALAISLICTGILAYLKSMWVVIAASTTGGLLLIDAWFDVMSHRSIFALHQATAMALLVEIPLALLSYYLAIKTIKHNNK